MKEKLFNKIKLILIGITLLSALFRFYDLNWDQGQHLHPDERAIVLAVDALHFPQTLQQFLSPNSPWNPHFFAYGSFPMYLLYAVGNLMGIVNPLFAQYDWINIAGRLLSALFDTALVIMIFKIGKKVRNEITGLIASFFYAVSVLPIQLSHFYAVDTLLTLLITTALYQLICFYEKATIKRALSIGIVLGLSIATKISAIVLVVPIAIVLFINLFLQYWEQPHKPHHWRSSLPKTIGYILSNSLIMGGTALIIFVLSEPYAFLDLQEFLMQNQQQAAMTKDAFVFPYTLQYVGIIPYWYEIKNIFLWGMGPILALVAFLGTIYITMSAGLSKTTKKTWVNEMILLSFFWVYFAIVGHFAIGFMRYMLPVYPLLCLFGALAINKIILSWLLPKKQFSIILLVLFAVLFLCWPVSFMHVYTQQNSRVLATEYINKNIPAGTGIAVEHWDDALPLGTGSYYQMQTLALYNPDTQDKWIQIVDQLKQVQYIIISSNRLYVPIQKLSDCNKYPFPRCYPVASMYYQNLFAGRPILQNTPYATLPGANSLVFKEVKQFGISPEIPILNLAINDQSADESFTVYDHAKVMIYKKESL